MSLLLRPCQYELIYKKKVFAEATVFQSLQIILCVNILACLNVLNDITSLRTGKRYENKTAELDTQAMYKIMFLL